MSNNSNSWGTCSNNGCNNIHFDKPPMVSDGRFYTAYDSTEATMQKIRQIEKLQTNWEYRNYLQKNAMNIMKYNNIECYYSQGIMNENVFNSDPNQPPFNYCGGKPSDLKSYYLSREELNAKMISPVININR